MISGYRIDRHASRDFNRITLLVEASQHVRVPCAVCRRDAGTGDAPKALDLEIPQKTPPVFATIALQRLRLVEMTSHLLFSRNAMQSLFLI